LGDWCICFCFFQSGIPIRKEVLHSSKKVEAAEVDASILEILEFGGGERERAWLLLAASVPRVCG
jgi:hypothetical protein